MRGIHIQNISMTKGKNLKNRMNQTKTKPKTRQKKNEKRKKEKKQ